MNKVVQFESQFASSLPATYALLTASNLTVHESVSRVTLHGSRGLAGGYRPDSDIDLSLIVETGQVSAQSHLEALLQDVWATILGNWQSPIEADVAVVFDVRGCGLKCFDQTAWDDQLCQQSAVDCFGLYKAQKGFSGIVTHSGVQVKRMYPCLTIWRRVR